MESKHLALESCASATGTVVVIDVLRAFTSAAYAFAAGAKEIVLVGHVDAAFALRDRMPGALLMGEVDGAPIPGFDFSNSPQHFDGADLRGRRLIQRTSHGTQGVVRAVQANTVLVTSFVVAAATAAYLRSAQSEEPTPSPVAFVVTGWQSELAGDGAPVEGVWGDEDAACADYLAALLRGETPDPTPYLARVYTSPTGRLFGDPAYSQYPATDLDYCTRLDRFDFALPVWRRDGLLVLRPQTVP